MLEEKRGAEAVITISDDAVVKERIKKGYREEHLDDQLRKTRTKREAKLIHLARKAGVPTPLISDVNLSTFTIEMSRIKGEKLKDVLDSMNKTKRSAACSMIGKYIGRLHSKDLIHGDLTTSNMILKDSKMYLIDFGLGEINESIESKGVDLLLFKKALQSAHWRVAEECFNEAIQAYTSEYEKAGEVLKRLQTIERRGRYFSER